MTAPPINNWEPPLWGEPLTAEDYVTLAASWITRELADEAGFRRVTTDEARDLIGQKRRADCSGLLIPYYWPENPSPINYRIRRDHPDVTAGSDGKLKFERRYLGAPGTSNRLYIPRGVTAAQLEATTTPIFLVEGEKKAMALWRLANHEVDAPRFIPIAIAGVWNWRGVVGKTGGPNGERLDVKGPIADLSRIRWEKRTVFIVFDTNVHHNDSVKWARKGIARELASREAAVKLVNLPEDCGVNGIDDLLAAWGPARVLDLFESAVPSAQLEVVIPPQFDYRPEGMFRITSRNGQLSRIQLSNFNAEIVANIRLDDGVESCREFEIKTELMGRLIPFTLPASEFGRMDWPIDKIGSGAITYPNQRDYARTAIQARSLSAEERCIYTHTGWRQVDGAWCYLHAGGAVGPRGPATDVSVRLAGQMGRFELLKPANPERLSDAVRASLRLADLGPPPVVFPLLAATWRSVLGNTDFAVHLAGETGAFKSAIAALFQQHLGATMDRLHLPGAWSSTGNALETMAFQAKDALFAIDDFAPQGSQADIAKYHSAADRVFRAAGNHAGRGRLDSTAKLRESKPPRSLILSTGEDIPRGQSIRARLLILDLRKGDVAPDNLTTCQTDATAGLYAQAMFGYLQWVAARYDEITEALQQRFNHLRTFAAGLGGHARTPEILANLQAGFDIFLQFSEECGAVDGTTRQNLAERCWDALRGASEAQAKHVAVAEPTDRFVAVLRSCLSSGQAHLASRQGSAPDMSARDCGWRGEGAVWTPHGSCVGWIDGDDIYLQPAAAYQVVQTASRASGEPLAVSEQMLKKFLRDKGMLASTDLKRETLTVRKKLSGSQKDVLHFRKSTIFPPAPEDDDGDVG